ncbi:GntR family transcriptional regulator [Sphaerisporangium aureirubrum]|uniref:GntR family transcriptional regulator n=1 Tax=Sphaerisporangium aureirubrum TaxID=1544736 RepID=A0ABW1NK47_9ACTN
MQGETYPPGAKLRSIRELASDYGVAHNTAQAAVRLLQSMGLVEIRVGSGAYVRDRLSDAPLIEELPHLRAELEQVREQVRQTKLVLAKTEQALNAIVDRLPSQVTRD